jgi:hypothetical protein
MLSSALDKENFLLQFQLLSFHTFSQQPKAPHNSFNNSLTCTTQHSQTSTQLTQFKHLTQSHKVSHSLVFKFQLQLYKIFICVYACIITIKSSFQIFYLSKPNVQLTFSFFSSTFSPIKQKGKPKTHPTTTTRKTQIPIPKPRSNYPPKPKFSPYTHK